MRRALLGGILTFGAASSALEATESAKPAKSGTTLDVVSEYDVPVAELSGLATAPTDGSVCLYAIGDASFDAAHLCADPKTGSPNIRVLALGGIFYPDTTGKDSQWEAVAVDGGGTVCMLAETKDRLTCFSGDFRHIVGRRNLYPSTIKGLGKAWWHDPNSRGEGIVLLKRGHVLVLKEKNPSMLVEFGPEGEAPLGFGSETLLSAGESFELTGAARLVALKVWRFSKKLSQLAEDASELAVGPDSRLYMLSDESRVLIRLESRLDVDEGKASPSAWWRLPKLIHKPEGLVIDSQMRPWVAIDNSHTDKPNLFCLGPI